MATTIEREAAQRPSRPSPAGDALVVLDDRDYKARLAQAEADLAVALAGVSNRARVGQAEAQVAQMQANAEKAHADLERIKPLAEKDIVPKQALDAAEAAARAADAGLAAAQAALLGAEDRKSTRLNSSHGYISYAVFCLKKKKTERRL